MKRQNNDRQADFLKPGDIEQIKGLEVRARTIVEGFISGLHKSPRHGFSVEFNQHKAYSPGDEIRSIDWRVFARTDKYFIKEYEEETNTSIHIVLDASGSMSYRMSGPIDKFSYAKDLAAAFTCLAVRQRDAAGLSVITNSIIETIPPSSKEIQLKNIISVLEHLRPKGLTDLNKSLSRLASSIRKRSLIIVLTDLLDDPEKIRESVDLLRFKNNEVVLMNILDRSEPEFPFINMVRFVDAETGDQITADIAGLKTRYLENFEKFQREMKQYALKSGMDYEIITTDQPYAQALRNYLIKRTVLLRKI